MMMKKVAILAAAMVGLLALPRAAEAEKPKPGKTASAPAPERTPWKFQETRDLKAEAGERAETTFSFTVPVTGAFRLAFKTTAPRHTAVDVTLDPKDSSDIARPVVRCRFGAESLCGAVFKAKPGDVYTVAISAAKSLRVETTAFETDHCGVEWESCSSSCDGEGYVQGDDNADAPGAEAAVKCLKKCRKQQDACNAGTIAAMQVPSAKLDAILIPIGRQAILKVVKAPSTTRFVSDRVLLQCPGHNRYATVHEIDSQNSFGAMIRTKLCVSVDDHKNIDAGECGNLVFAENAAAIELGYGAIKNFCDIGLR